MFDNCLTFITYAFDKLVDLDQTPKELSGRHGRMYLFYVCI